jgi:hypothetical protein
MEDENKLLCLQKNMLNQNCFIMGKYEKWKKGRTDHLAEWIKERNNNIQPPMGEYNGEYYKYILPIEHNNTTSKLDAIKKYHAFTNDVEIDNSLPQEEIHRFAHHLNSSQMLCYNYFRLHTDEKLILKEEMRDRLKDKLGIKLSKSAICKFEYKDNVEEGTSFDFYITDGEKEIFFEIKYTEQEFSHADNDERHRTKFDEIYSELLKKNRACNPQLKFEDIRLYYQLFRNAIRVTDDKKYVVFIYPKGNSACDNQYNRFAGITKRKGEPDCLTGELKDNVKRIYWEELITKDSDSELFEKYFAE